MGTKKQKKLTKRQIEDAIAGGYEYAVDQPKNVEHGGVDAVAYDLADAAITAGEAPQHLRDALADYIGQGIEKRQKEVAEAAKQTEGEEQKTAEQSEVAKGGNGSKPKRKRKPQIKFDESGQANLWVMWRLNEQQIEALTHLYLKEGDDDSTFSEWLAAEVECCPFEILREKAFDTLTTDRAAAEEKAQRKDAEEAAK